MYGTKKKINHLRLLANYTTSWKLPNWSSQTFIHGDIRALSCFAQFIAFSSSVYSKQNGMRAWMVFSFSEIAISSKCKASSTTFGFPVNPINYTSSRNWCEHLITSFNSCILSSVIVWNNRMINDFLHTAAKPVIIIITSVPLLLQYMITSTTLFIGIFIDIFHDPPPWKSSATKMKLVIFLHFYYGIISIYINKFKWERRKKPIWWITILIL